MIKFCLVNSSWTIISFSHRKKLIAGWFPSIHFLRLNKLLLFFVNYYCRYWLSLTNIDTFSFIITLKQVKYSSWIIRSLSSTLYLVILMKLTYHSYIWNLNLISMATYFMLMWNYLSFIIFMVLNETLLSFLRNKFGLAFVFPVIF